MVRDIAIYPINPTEVPLDDEEGQEPALKKHMTAQRKLSGQLLEVSYLVSEWATPQPENKEDRVTEERDLSSLL